MDTASFSAGAAYKISGPAELLQAVPYLLGFHPERSVVLVGLHAGQLVVTARIDITDAEAVGVLTHAIDAMARAGSTAVVVAVYDDDAGDLLTEGWLPHLTLAVRIDASVEAAGCELVDTLLVSRGRWWSLVCDVPDCCPPEGRALPAAPSAFAAAATVDGVVALPGRASLEALLEPLPADERAALEPAVEEAENAALAAVLDGRGERASRSVKRALFAAARESDEPGWRGPDEAAVARFGAALAAADIRDALWTAVDARRIDGRPLWLHLARRLPSPYDATPLLLYGWAAWRCGNGALAGIAAQRALTSVPGYRAAELLLGAVAEAVDPWRAPKLRLPRSA